MMLLGMHDGVGLRFDEGALSAIEFAGFARSFALREDFDAAPGPPGAALPYLPLESSLDMSDVRYRGLDPYTGRQVRQSLPSGQRTVCILQRQSLPGASLPEPLLARAHMDVNLTAPLVYRLRTDGDAVWESDEAGAEAYLGKGCTVRVSATVSLAIEDKGHSLRLDLPAGWSTVEIWIEGQPPLPFAPAVIVCTSGQMREAAVVTSAVGSAEHAYVPLLDLDLPPASVEDFQQDNARLAEISQQLSDLEQKMTTVAQEGAQAAGGIILPGAQSTEQSLQQLELQRNGLLSDLEPLQQRILAYATWSRRSSVVTRLIASLTAGSRESPRLFVLSPYPADLLAEWGMTADMTSLFAESSLGAMMAWQQSVQDLLDHQQMEIVLWKDVEDLGRQVWTRVRGQTEPAFFTIPDDPAFYPAGLLDALRRGRVLLPRGHAGKNVNLDAIVDKLNAGLSSDHAVIVEADGSTASLIGTLYAHQTGARFYVNPLPRFDQVFGRMRVITGGYEKEQLAALAANAYRYIGEHRKQFMQSKTADPQLKQVAAGLSILELSASVPTPYSDQAFVQALSTYFTAQQAGAQQGYRYDDAQWQKDLAELEAQVSASLSEHVRKAVADVSRVTVFTTGLPYALAAGLEGKAVGLILRDVAAPYTLRTVARGCVARPALTMALSVDPGLGRRPAPEAAEIVDRTITLRGPAASLANLAVMAASLPLDAILLQTQGGVDSLILGDARNRLREVHVSEVGSQVNLPSMPLVIYGAPLAWLGLGVTLLQQGAAGFVGTLWPMLNGAADDATRLLLTGALVKGQNPAEALLNLPGFDPRLSRGFVYLGTAASWPAPGNKALQGMPALYAVAARLAASGRADAATMVYDRMRALIGETAAGNPALRAEMLLLDADYQTRLNSRTRQRPSQDVADKVWQSLDALDKLSLPEQEKKTLQAALWERVAVLDMIAENYQRAAELLAAARDAHRQGGQTAAALSAAYLLSMVQERQRQWAAARQTLLDVQSGLAGVGNAVGLVSVATSLAYVSLPLAMYPDVLGHLKMAVQASLALGVHVLSETLLQVLQVGKAMTQMGANAEVVTMARTLAGVIRGEGRLPESDRAAIAGMLGLMQETAEVLQAGLPAEEREAKLAALVEKAQANELANSLGMGAWILGAGAPPSRDAETEG